MIPSDTFLARIWGRNVFVRYELQNYSLDDRR